MPTHSRWHQPPTYAFTLAWDIGGSSVGNLTGSLPTFGSPGPTVDGFPTTWNFGISEYAEVGIGRGHDYFAPNPEPTAADFAADVSEVNDGPGSGFGVEDFVAQMASTIINNSGDPEWVFGALQGGLLVRLFPPYPGPVIASWPAGAYNVEFEDDSGGTIFANVAAKMSGVTAQLDYSAGTLNVDSAPGSVRVLKIPPSEHAAYAGFGGQQWHRPGAVFASWPLVTTLPASSPTTGSLIIPVTSADWSSTRLGVFTLTTAEATDTPPSFLTMPPTFGDQADNGYVLRPTKLTLSGTFRPPQFRFLFNTQPKLRQSPRDDALGGAPRQGKTNGSTSVQASARQGWRGTYR